MLHVLDGLGSGDPIVLLHGLGTGARGWQPQLDALAQHRLALAPDLPGFGRSSGPFTIQRACDELVAMLDRRDLGVVDVCGLSLGALVALELALKHPQRIRRIVLCAGFAYLPDDLRSQQQTMARLLRSKSTDAGPSVITDLTVGVPDPHRSIAAEDLAGLTPSDLAQIIDGTSDYNRATETQTAEIEAVVCCGSLDELNISLSQDLAVRLKTELQLIPGAGHVANLDAEQAFNALLLRTSAQAG